MTIFCQDCGNELATQYNFCPACGSKNLGSSRRPTVQTTRTPFVQVPPVSPPHNASGAVPANSHPTTLLSKHVAYAGFWRRVAAYMIDWLVLLVPSFALGALLGGVLGDVGAALAQIAALILSWVYFASMESSPRQGTVGKRAMGLRVCDINGQRISFGKATGRHFGKILSALIICIGYLMVAFTDRNQGLHDKMAGTLVLHLAE